MPGDAELAREDWEQGQPPDDQALNLLHRTGLAALALTAEVHEWTDAMPSIQSLKMLQEKMPAPLQGIFGPDAVLDAFSDRVAEDRGGHRVARLAVGIPAGTGSTTYPATGTSDTRRSHATENTQPS
jgi:hypothetical protein